VQLPALEDVKGLIRPKEGQGGSVGKVIEQDLVIRDRKQVDSPLFWTTL
jgi:hypothetical protein